MTKNSSSGFIRTEEQARIDAEALRLRSAGMSYQKIANAMDCSKPTAYDRVNRALAAIPFEAVDEYRRIEGQRLDMLMEIAMDKALSGDKGSLFAIDRVLAIQERAAKLRGLDAPIKHEVITLDYIQSEIRRLEETLGEDGNIIDAEVVGVETTRSIGAAQT
jgi:DNA-binding Lrp family transcriptional regulator